jgi:hypothetical protein
MFSLWRDLQGGCGGKISYGGKRLKEDVPTPRDIADKAAEDSYRRWVASEYYTINWIALRECAELAIRMYMKAQKEKEERW